MAQFIEVFFGWMKPTHAQYMTTYYTVIQWKGKLTGQAYHKHEGTWAVGPSPRVKAENL